MSMTNLKLIADRLPTAWRSSLVGMIGSSTFKVSRMNSSAYPLETHDYTEALLVLGGEMCLEVATVPVIVRSGEVYIVPAGVAHAVGPGSHGTLVIVEGLTAP